MSRNRIKSDNQLPIRWILRIVTLAVFAIAYGLLVVFGQLQSDRLAKDNKKLEQELVERETKTRRLELERQKLTMPEALEKRLALHRIELVPLNRLQVIDAQSFHQPGTAMLARRPNGRAVP